MAALPLHLIRAGDAYEAAVRAYVVAVRRGSRERGSVPAVAVPPPPPGLADAEAWALGWRETAMAAAVAWNRREIEQGRGRPGTLTRVVECPICCTRWAIPAADETTDCPVCGGDRSRAEAAGLPPRKHHSPPGEGSRPRPSRRRQQEQGRA